MTDQGSDPSRDTSLSLAASARIHPSAGDRAWDQSQDAVAHS